MKKTTARGVKDAAGTEAVSERILDHISALRRYAILLVGNITDADDIVQEALARILAKSGIWNNVNDMRSYLFSAVHNVYIDHTRKQKRVAHNMPIENVLATLSSPAVQHKRLELRDLVIALSKLPTEQREIVLLVGIEGMSYAEAAKTLDIPIGTVMSRLSRGREALRLMTSHGGPRKLRVVK